MTWSRWVAQQTLFFWGNKYWQNVNNPNSEIFRQRWSQQESLFSIVESFYIPTLHIYHPGQDYYPQNKSRQRWKCKCINYSAVWRWLGPPKRHRCEVSQRQVVYTIAGWFSLRMLYKRHPSDAELVQKLMELFLTPSCRCLLFLLHSPYTDDTMKVLLSDKEKVLLCWAGCKVAISRQTNVGFHQNWKCQGFKRSLLRQRVWLYLEESDDFLPATWGISHEYSCLLHRQEGKKKFWKVLVFSLK